MQSSFHRGKIKTNSGWLHCPVCGQKLIKLLPNTRASNLLVYCRKCGEESVVNIPSAPAP